MSRILDHKTLDNAGRIWAGHLLLPSAYSKRNPKVAIGGRAWAIQSLFKADYRDEHDYLMAVVKDQLGSGAVTEFERDTKGLFVPRSDEVFASILADKLAIDMDGNHIPGKIGTVKMGDRLVGRRITRHGVRPAYWNTYAGEEEERALGNVRAKGTEGVGADPLPPEDTLWPGEQDHLGIVEMYALNTNVSIAFAQAGVDASLDLLDEGTADAVIRGVSGTQPVDPNAALTGSTLFSLDMGTPGFGASSDDAPGALATAAAIADDISADATNTITHCRVSSANTLIVPLNDHIDGSAGLTSGTFDFEFNTDAIVSGANIAMTAYTFKQPQGPTAT